MALDAEKLYTTIYKDLARKKNMITSAEPTGDGILTADWTIMDSSDTAHKRGMIDEGVVDTADGDATRLVIDLIASSVSDRVIQHILGYPDNPNPDVNVGGGFDETLPVGVLHEGLRTTAAENQIIALKDHVADLGEKVKLMGDEIIALNDQNQALITELITLSSNTALTNTNILTMITAWNTLNTSLATGIPATMAAGVATFTNTMASLVTSWTNIAAAHTTFSTMTMATHTTQYVALQSQVTEVQGQIDSILATADSTFIVGSAQTVE